MEKATHGYSSGGEIKLYPNISAVKFQELQNLMIAKISAQHPLLNNFIMDLEYKDPSTVNLDTIDEYINGSAKDKDYLKKERFFWIE